jgi:hypothetical protein
MVIRHAVHRQVGEVFDLARCACRVSRDREHIGENLVATSYFIGTASPAMAESGGYSVVPQPLPAMEQSSRRAIRKSTASQRDANFRVTLSRLQAAMG